MKRIILIPLFIAICLIVCIPAVITEVYELDERWLDWVHEHIVLRMYKWAATRASTPETPGAET